MNLRKSQSNHLLIQSGYRSRIILIKLKSRLSYGWIKETKSWMKLSNTLLISLIPFLLLPCNKFTPSLTFHCVVVDANRWKIEWIFTDEKREKSSFSHVHRSTQRSDIHAIFKSLFYFSVFYKLSTFSSHLLSPFHSGAFSMILEMEKKARYRRWDESVRRWKWSLSQAGVRV